MSAHGGKPGSDLDPDSQPPDMIRRNFNPLSLFGSGMRWCGWRLKRCGSAVDFCVMKSRTLGVLSVLRRLGDGVCVEESPEVLAELFCGSGSDSA